MLTLNTSLVTHFAIAIGIGLIIGAEREKHRQGAAEKSAQGIRTFTMATLLGAVTALIHFWLFALAILCVMVFSAIAYARQINEHPGMTTEIALMLSVVLGGLCLTAPELAAALAVVISILLATKETLHAFVLGMLSKEELNDFLILAAATVVILPLVPDQFIGPYHAINPRNLWLIVILVMVIGALSHVVLRVLGSRIGLPVIGLLSGFISSIATITTMGERAKETPYLMHGAIAGALLSSLATILQLALLLFVISPSTLMVLAWPLLFGALSITVYALIIGLRAGHERNVPITYTPYQTFKPGTAFTLAAVIALMLILASALKDWLGLNGLLAVSAISGLVDVHAPTIAVATLVATGKLAHSQAALPILLAFSVNAASKVFMACITGPRPFWQAVSLGVLAQIALTWLGWWFFIAHP